jgi:1-deoxy-D-xylulose-5-phosphate reductoisomerase
LKRIAVLGSTGSIGTQTLDIVRKNKNKLKVSLLSASKFSEKLKKQIDEFKPEYVYLANYPKNLKIDNIKILTGLDGIKELANLDIDVYINGIAGISGIEATYYLLINNKNLATANKEAIICLGEILREHYRFIIPVDSEHSAIYQIIKNENKKDIKKIILTASGGPFFRKSVEYIKNVSPEEALNHPKWKMGKKVSIDSATLMNKGLEVIEAHYLFNLDYSQIDVVIHPNSIIHGIVNYIDGTFIANLSIPDMRIPISYALSLPERWEIDLEELDLVKISKLEFYEPNTDKFPLLKLAYTVGKLGGGYPIVLTTADELAVNLFLEGKIKFTDIYKLVSETIENIDIKPPRNLEDIYSIIEETKKVFKEIEKKITRG